MNRRGFLRGILAGAALATGLARTRLELERVVTAEDVAESGLTFQGVAILFEKLPRNLEADYVVVSEDVWRAWKEAIA